MSMEQSTLLFIHKE